MKYNIFKLIVAFCIVFGTTNLLAESVVVVHPSNTANFSQSIVAEIFLGKSKKYSNGTKAKPIALNEKSKVQSDFNKNILRKSSAQLNSYWSKRIFTGRGRPPKVFETSDDIKKQIINNTDVIGVMDEGAVDDSVKIVLRF